MRIAMHYEMNVWHALTARVRQGDRVATAEFRDSFPQSLAPIVRWVLRTGAARVRLHRQIQAEIDQLSDHDFPAPDPEGLVEQVARRVCEATIADLQAGRRSDRAALETVRA
jgi:hypothetical protein